MFLKRAVEQSPFIANMVRASRDHLAQRSLKWQTVPEFGFEMLGGNWFAAGNYDGISASVHELSELRIIANIIDEDTILVDVGANSGLFCLLAAIKGGGAIALEPMQNNLAILLSNIIRNDLQTRIEVLPVGASDQIGIFPFYGSGQVASLLAGWANQLRVKPILVPVSTLDSLLYEKLRTRKFVIKIDVEGAEFAVLNGAGSLLALRPPLLIENSLTRNHPQGFNPFFEGVFKMLWQMGYTAKVADGSGSVVTPDILAVWIAQQYTNLATENYFFNVE